MNAPAGGSAYHATDGASYEVFLGRWTRRLAEPLLDFAGFTIAGPVLDVGCGTGSLAYAMAARWPGHSVVGIDIAPPYIAFARSRADLANPLRWRMLSGCPTRMHPLVVLRPNSFSIL